MVNGRIIMDKGQLLTVDEEVLGNRLAEAASRPRKAAEEATVKALDELRRYVVRFYQGWLQKVEVMPYLAINSRVDGLK